MDQQPSRLARQSESCVAGGYVGQARQEKGKKNRRERQGKKNEETPQDGVRSSARSSGETSSVLSASSAVKGLEGARQAPIPSKITPMLATSVDDPFDDPEWLFEIKWDGYRAV